MSFYTYPAQKTLPQEDLTTISQVTDNIFLSGVMPMEVTPDVIRENNITCILCCVKKKNAIAAHNKIIMDNPNVIILYLPYDDMLYQNLWTRNNDLIDMYMYSGSVYDNSEIENKFKLYANRPLIEIGYRFIDDAVLARKNVLVHCMAGISRSVSLVTYYLMKKFGTGFDRTLGFVKSKRNIADPNSSFKGQLRMYEKMREKFNARYADDIIKRVS